MMQDRKYFGMNTQQVGILTGLALVFCLLCGVTGVLALRGGLSGFVSRQPENTQVVQPTATVVFTPTVQVTATPTPIPYEQLIPAGWIQFKNDLVELWLPSNYKLVDIEKLKADARKRYQATGLQELVEYNDRNTEFFTLVVADESSGSALYRTIVSISYKPLTYDSLDTYLDAHISELPSMITVVERRKVTVNASEAVRLVHEMRQGTIYANELDYIFLDGSTIWIVGYYAEINEFYQQLPLFEDSIKTFRIVR